MNILCLLGCHDWRFIKRDGKKVARFCQLCPRQEVRREVYERISATEAWRRLES